MDTQNKSRCLNAESENLRRVVEELAQKGQDTDKFQTYNEYLVYRLFSSNKKKKSKIVLEELRKKLKKYRIEVTFTCNKRKGKKQKKNKTNRHKKKEDLSNKAETLKNNCVQVCKCACLEKCRQCWKNHKTQTKGNECRVSNTNTKESTMSKKFKDVGTIYYPLRIFYGPGYGKKQQ